MALDISSADNAFQYGELLLVTGQKAKGIEYLKKAEKRYLDILNSLATYKTINRKHIYKIYRFFISQGNLFQATEVLMQGEILLPSNSSIRIMLGDLYKKQGILFKAKEKYEEALILDPKNRGAKVRLDRLNQ